MVMGLKKWWKMDNTVLINIDHHKSRERIKNLGEVFTPEHYVQQMLNTIDSSIWADENAIFFEPSAGLGHIVLPIMARRIDALSRKYKNIGEVDPMLWSIATTLNTIWAIDICPVNVDFLRTRIFGMVIRLLLKHDYQPASLRHREFICHVICTLIWQICENEALSALSTPIQSIREGSKTKIGREWLKNNKQRQLIFKNDWCTHYNQRTARGVSTVLYERTKKFVTMILSHNSAIGFREFAFSQSILENLINHESIHNVGVA